VLISTGDTLYGTRQGNRMIGGAFFRNATIVYDPSATAEDRCFTSYKPATMSGFLYAGPDAGVHYFWPAAVVPFRPEDTMSYAFASVIESDPAATGILNFRQTGTAVLPIAYRPAAAEPLTSGAAVRLVPVQTPDRNPIAWGYSVLDDGGWTYIYATHLSEGGDLAAVARDLFVARVPATAARSDLANLRNWQLWTGSGWRQYPGAPLPLSQMQAVGTDIVGPNYSVSRNPATGRYYLVTRPNEFLDDKVRISTAASPVGPFTVVRDIPLPQPTDTWYYNAHAHPDLPAPPNKVWITVDVGHENGNVFTDPLENAKPLWILIDVPS
jgi:hypothetical protein